MKERAWNKIKEPVSSFGEDENKGSVGIVVVKATLDLTMFTELARLCTFKCKSDHTHSDNGHILATMVEFFTGVYYF